MAEILLLTDKETMQLKTLEYDGLIDWQFNLLTDLINISNEIIHKEYKDDNLLQQGVYMVRVMVLINMINRSFLERFPGSKMSKLIKEQYTNDKEVIDSINEEVKILREYFNDFLEILKKDFDDKDRLLEAMNAVNKMATYNLREYEDLLNRVFGEPVK